DEWQITRWTRETGSNVKNFLFGSGEPQQPPQNSPQQQYNPQQPSGQPYAYAVTPSYGQQPQPGVNPPGYNGAAPVNRMATRPVYQPQAPTNPSAPQPASPPWYKFW